MEKKSHRRTGHQFYNSVQDLFQDSLTIKREQFEAGKVRWVTYYEYDSLRRFQKIIMFEDGKAESKTQLEYLYNEKGQLKESKSDGYKVIYISGGDYGDRVIEKRVQYSFQYEYNEKGLLSKFTKYEDGGLTEIKMYRYSFYR